MGRYDELDEAHRRADEGRDRQLEEQRRHEAERGASEKESLEPQKQDQAAHDGVRDVERATMVPLNNHEKNWDRRDELRSGMAAAILEGNEERVAEYKGQAASAGLNPTEEWQAAERLALDPQFQQRHAEKLLQEQRSQNAEIASNFNAIREAPEGLKERGDQTSVAQQRATERAQERTDDDAYFLAMVRRGRDNGRERD